MHQISKAPCQSIDQLTASIYYLLRRRHYMPVKTSTHAHSFICTDRPLNEIVNPPKHARIVDLNPTQLPLPQTRTLDGAEKWTVKDNERKKKKVHTSQ